MANRRAAPRFTGVLNEPIVETVTISLAALADPTVYESDVEAAIQRGIRQQVEKMFVLLMHYDIDPEAANCWQLLSFSLARDFVPGMLVLFHEPPRRGRKGTWKTGLGDELVQAVQTHKQKAGKNVRDTIADLKKRDSGRWDHYTKQNLEARYREANKRQRDMRMRLAAALMAPPMEGMSLADIAMRYNAARMGGLFGLGSESIPRPGAENTTAQVRVVYGRLGRPSTALARMRAPENRAPKIRRRRNCSMIFFRRSNGSTFRTHPRSRGRGRRHTAGSSGEDPMDTPLAYSVAEACAVARIGRTALYEAIRSGQLRAVKRGRRTLFLPDDLRQWLAALPAMAPSKPTASDAV